MIICPFCESPLTDQSGQPIADSFIGYSRCLASIPVSEEFSHYRQISHEDRPTTHFASFPPFEICRHYLGSLSVHQTFPNSNVAKYVYFSPQATFKEFVRICQRFQNLKAFL